MSYPLDELGVETAEVINVCRCFITWHTNNRLAHFEITGLILNSFFPTSRLNVFFIFFPLCERETAAVVTSAYLLQHLRSRQASCFQLLRLGGINGWEKIRVDEWKIASRRCVVCARGCFQVDRLRLGKPQLPVRVKSGLLKVGLEDQ